MPTNGALRVLASLYRRVVASPRRAGAPGTLGIWLSYVAVVSLLAEAAANRATPRSHDVPAFLLHGFINSVDEAPPLARWDSIWFYGIAAEGYAGSSADSRFTPGFLPLYPFLMRAVALVGGLDYFTAGIWISRLALLAVLALLPIAASDGSSAGAASSRSMQLCLLAFPTAFILVSVYTESLFLALALAAFVCARRDRQGWAAVAAFLAALTRLHGMALVPALGAMGWMQWRSGRRSAWVAAPAAGAAAAYATLAVYFWRQFGDPLQYLTAKQEGWGTRLATPWATIDQAVVRLEQALTNPDIGALLTSLEVPCLLLIVFAIAASCHRRNAPEMLFVAFGLALSLVSGLLWGLPRFTLVFFPVFIFLAGLHRHRAWWYAYLVASGFLQACLLVNYVNFSPPAP